MLGAQQKNTGVAGVFLRALAVLPRCTGSVPAGMSPGPLAFGGPFGRW